MFLILTELSKRVPILQWAWKRSVTLVLYLIQCVSLRHWSFLLALFEILFLTNHETYTEYLLYQEYIAVLLNVSFDKGPNCYFRTLLYVSDHSNQIQAGVVPWISSALGHARLAAGRLWKWITMLDPMKCLLLMVIEI